MAILDHFQTKNSNIRPLLSITFPQGFRISKNIGHPTSRHGGKKNVKRYLKSEQTNGQTDTQTDAFKRLIQLIQLETIVDRAPYLWTSAVNVELLSNIWGET